MAKKKVETSVPVQEPVVIKAYKGFDKDLKCRGFQFEVEKTYTHDGPVRACESGFHSCENPLDVLSYYDIGSDNRFALVTASGEISKHDGDTKIASASIKIEAELRLRDIVAAAVEWVKKACEFTGDKIASGWNSKLATSGGNSQLAASGDDSKLAASGWNSKLAASGWNSKLAASGWNSQLAASGGNSKLAASGGNSQLAASGGNSQLAASGRNSQLAASGWNSKLAASGGNSQLAASGDDSKLAASGKSSIAMASAPNCSAKVGKNGTIALTRWVESEKRYRVSVAYVGESGIKPDTFYLLDANGEFIEVKE